MVAPGCTGRLGDAEKAYTEALTIYRELAVDNPGTYAERVTFLRAELTKLDKAKSRFGGKE